MDDFSLLKEIDDLSELKEIVDKNNIPLIESKIAFALRNLYLRTISKQKPKLPLDERQKTR